MRAGARRRRHRRAADRCSTTRQRVRLSRGFSPDGTRLAVVREKRSTPHEPGDRAGSRVGRRGGRASPRPQRRLGPLAGRPVRVDARRRRRWSLVADEDGRAPVFRIDAGERRVHPAHRRRLRLLRRAGLARRRDRLRAAHVVRRAAAAGAPRRPHARPGARRRCRRPATRRPCPARSPRSRPRPTTACGCARGWRCPRARRPTSPAPLLLWIHGGPLGSWNAWSWRWNPWLAVARGYAVLLPDPALSTGYGLDFIQRGWGALGRRRRTPT